MMNFFQKYVKDMSEKIMNVDTGLLDEAKNLILSAHEKGGKVIIAGNGGSAAMASHVSVDLTKNSRVRSVNFNEADLITCFSNDYGYEHWIEKAIEFYAQSNDIVILISSSGRSPNMIQAARKSKEMGLPLITLTGFNADNPLRKTGKINFWVDSQSYNVVEMTHHVWLLAIADRIIEQVKLYPLELGIKEEGLS
jgi:D-sedoheptulose 7-phosphate isomerase